MPTSADNIKLGIARKHQSEIRGGAAQKGSVRGAVGNRRHRRGEQASERGCTYDFSKMKHSKLSINQDKVEEIREKARIRSMKRRKKLKQEKHDEIRALLMAQVENEQLKQENETLRRRYGEMLRAVGMEQASTFRNTASGNINALFADALQQQQQQSSSTLMNGLSSLLNVAPSSMSVTMPSPHLAALTPHVPIRNRNAWPVDVGLQGFLSLPRSNFMHL